MIEKGPQMHKVSRHIEARGESHSEGQALLKSFALLVLLFWSVFAIGAPRKTPPAAKANASLQPWAVVHTTMGTMVIQLYEKQVPKTVAHFIALAEGTKPWKDPKTKRTVTKPFYDGLAIHKIVPTYWVQMGCPIGNGKGDPGFTIKAEYNSSLKHQGAGVVSMAHAGNGRNGSQFFITVRSAKWLDHKVQTKKFCSNFKSPVPCLNNSHCKRYARMFPSSSKGAASCKVRKISNGYTIFGKVVHGLRVMTQIAEQPVDVNGRPIRKITIKRLSIHRASRWLRIWLRNTQPAPRNR